MRQLTSRTGPAVAYSRRRIARAVPADGGVPADGAVPADVARPASARRTTGTSRVSRLRLSRAAWAS
jgi:hypothetical protein